MNNNQIFNPKKEVPSGLTLNEKDYINELLSCLKDMEKNYVVAMIESSNEILYNKFYNMFVELANLERETYELMFKNGWYCLEKAETKKINQKYQKLNQELQSLNN